MVKLDTRFVVTNHLQLGQDLANLSWKGCF